MRNFSNQAMTPLKRIDVDLRASGLESLRQAEVLFEYDQRSSEEHYRNALRNLSEAFLEDRRGNRDLFVVCHRIGSIIEQFFGCHLEFSKASRSYSSTCPIGALHSRLGLSIGAFSESECSICGAGDFECDHVPGEKYEGQRCQRKITNMQLDHVALTPNPDFAYTFMMNVPISLKEMEAQVGQSLSGTEPIVSTHCRDCYGRWESRAEDLDPSLWAPIDPKSKDL